MPKIIAYLRKLLAEEPAAVAWLLSGGIAMLSAYAFHWDHAQQAAAATITTALAAAYSALRARPAHIQVATGALAAVLAAAATFGFHPPARVEAIVLAGASIALAFLFRANVTPVAKIRTAQRELAGRQKPAQPPPSRRLVDPKQRL